MSKKTKHHKSELEELREEVKTLRKLVKHQKRELGKTRRVAKAVVLENDCDEDDYVELPDNLDKCMQCGKGQIITSNLGVRMLESCSICNYRKITKV